MMLLATLPKHTHAASETHIKATRRDSKVEKIKLATTGLVCT